VRVSRRRLPSSAPGSSAPLRVFRRCFGEILHDVHTRADVEAWLAAYERAWRTAGTTSLGELFTDEATYQLSPYETPLAGLAKIAEMWDDEREGPDERFTMKRRVVALEDDVAVVRVEVAYEDSPRREYRDLWVIRFSEDGRCAAFEEWPFWPDQPRTAVTAE
jgi:SnoaL-like domain